MRVDPERLQVFAGEVLEALGVPAAEARLTARCLVDADLEGQASHGVVRLPLTAARLRDGLIAAAPEMRVLAERPATALLDAGNGLGPVSGTRAMGIAIEKARASGIGMCAVRRGNHLGALSFYVRLATDAGLIGIALCNTPPAMAPPGGLTAHLGTNPIAAGIPTSAAPVVIDMATSQVARGRVLQARAAGAPIPAGWALDRSGRPTTDAAAALEGSLSPLGGAKGFALALLVEALSAVLAGAAVGPGVAGTFQASDRPSDVGQSFVAIDPAAFDPGFLDRMDGLAAGLREVAPAHPGEPVRLPGDRRVREREARAREGIELPESLAAELGAIAGAHGLAPLG